MFPKNQSIHSYATRRSNELHLPLCRTVFAQNTFIYNGPKLWNSFNNDIKASPSLNTLKNKLKSFCSNLTVIHKITNNNIETFQ